MTERDISRFGYHSEEDWDYFQKQQQDLTPESVRKTVASLKKLAQVDPSVRPALVEAERRLERLLKHD